MLLDTGSPISFGSVGTLNFMGRPRAISRTGPLISIAQIAAGIRGLPRAAGEQLQLEALLGCDLLMGCSVAVRWSERLITCVPRRAPPSTDLLGTIPRIELAIDGRPVTGVADTGAHVTYVLPTHARGVRTVGTIEDFYPSVGAFTANLVSKAIRIGGRSLQIEVAVAPPLVTALMQCMGASAIIGTDILSRSDRTCFSFGDSESEAIM